MRELTPELIALAQSLDADLAAVPAGAFQYGLDEDRLRQAADSAGVHPDMLKFHSPATCASTGEFWIDRYPVTRVQFARFEQETGYRRDFNGYNVGWTELADAWDLSRPELALAPAVEVSSADAAAYAQWLGKRLPTEVEWEKAARGTDGRPFPSGKRFKGPLGTGNLPLVGPPPVGASPGNVSPYGVHDQCGLVSEWVVRSADHSAARGAGTPHADCYLAGGCWLHVQEYSHRATNRLAWDPKMRIYSAGFRCCCDAPPARLARARLPKYDSPLPAPLPLDRDLLDQPVRLEPLGCASVRIVVPWLPGGMWVLDCPEATWGPFGGANAWPYHDESEWRIPWQTDGPGRAWYERRIDDKSVRFDIWTEGPLVRYRMAVAGVELNPASFCLKTLSPQFSSQERVTQFRRGPDGDVHACDLPLGEHLGSMAWSVGPVDDGVLMFHSYDGDAYVAVVGEPGSVTWGNSWPHCTHLGAAPGGQSDVLERAILFHAGSRESFDQAVAKLV